MAWDSCRSVTSQPSWTRQWPVASPWSLNPRPLCADQTAINIWHALHLMRRLHEHELTCHFFLQGYEADNPNIDLLRLRNFTAGCKLKEDEVLAPTLLGRIAELVSAMHPFVSSFFCHSFVLPLSSGRRHQSISTHTYLFTPPLSPLHRLFIFQRLLRETPKLPLRKPAAQPSSGPGGWTSSMTEIGLLDSFSLTQYN
jgi:hypothetical protein